MLRRCGQSTHRTCKGNHHPTERGHPIHTRRQPLGHNQITPSDHTQPHLADKIHVRVPIRIHGLQHRLRRQRLVVHCTPRLRGEHQPGSIDPHRAARSVVDRLVRRRHPGSGRDHGEVHIPVQTEGKGLSLSQPGVVLEEGTDRVNLALPVVHRYPQPAEGQRLGLSVVHSDHLVGIRSFEPEHPLPEVRCTRGVDRDFRHLQGKSIGSAPVLQGEIQHVDCVVGRIRRGRQGHRFVDSCGNHQRSVPVRGDDKAVGWGEFARCVHPHSVHPPVVDAVLERLCEGVFADYGAPNDLSRKLRVVRIFHPVPRCSQHIAPVQSGGNSGLDRSIQLDQHRESEVLGHLPEPGLHG